MTDVMDDEGNFEELYGAWEPKLYAAAMAENDRYFALLLGGTRWDDPYTIILTRDAVGQTFSRSDVRRELRDIRVLPSSDSNAYPSYVTISRSGDIYVVRPAGSEHFVIPRTQAESEDAPDIEFNSIFPVGDNWLVSGSDGVMKLGKSTTWEDVAPKLETKYPYSPPKWSILGANANGDISVIAVEMSNTRYFNLYPGHELYRDDMSEDEEDELQAKLYAEQKTYPMLTTLFTGRPGAWKRQELPQRIASSLPAYPYVSGQVSGKTGRDYIFGSDGLIMEAMPSVDFSEIGSLPDREKHYSSGAFWRGDLILVAGSELLRFDGHLTTPFSPKVRVKLGSPRVQPSAVFGRDEKLYVFDYGLRYFILDGNEWNQREIPTDLTERPFKGGGEK
ncbi:hypothetical protein C8J36_107135 [Rhizobium sp. PP-F2F-G48]|uniref:hypothetical protein n=1 Tax=Rhizobium sp. PP-F2F-G48 TaxID=2135651 RepID=UPI0010D57997|nr:hypothetical protein [Rhizobium sp. PP-F2F-G48]TCM53173.1 hypothetical protein C8J36_107135 [Rhizobium sp. PP-F2F-G48]